MATTTAPPTTALVPTTAAPTTTIPVPALPAVPPGPVRAVLTPTGVVVPVNAVAPGGWQVTTPCGRAAVAGGTPLTGALVVLDAGHGGDEPGAVAPNGLREKDVNLAVVRTAKAALEQRGASVVLTRTGDYRVTLSTRAEIVTRLAPRAFVSIHHNASADGPWPRPGTETYYQIASADSKRLAGLVYEEVVRALEPYKIAWTADRDAGAKYRLNDRGGDYYAILRQTAGVTSVLGELSMMTSPDESALMARLDVQQAEGAAVARAIVRYFTTRDPGSGFVEPYPRTEPAGNGGGQRGCIDPPLG